MATAEPLESSITKSILKKLRSLGGWWTKIPGNRMQAGLPDIIGCYKGRFCGLEVKRPSNRDGVTPRQQKVLAAITKAGGLSVVVTSVDEAIKAVTYDDPSSF